MNKPTARRGIGNAVLALAALLALPAFAQPDVHTILQRSLEANDRDWNAAPGYSFTEKSRDKGGTETHTVEMIDGSPYSRLVAVNGEPLSPGRQAEEQRKLEQAIAQRRSESPGQRAARVADYEQGRKRDHLMLAQLTAAMNFKLVGRRSVGGYQCYVLRATPKPGYRPPNTASQVLTGMRGTLWIDSQSFQWVKVEARVIHPVYMEGFLARVEPGTRFELEKRPVANGIWLKSHFSMSARAKILFLLPYHTAEEDWYSNYRGASAPNPPPPAGE